MSRFATSWTGPVLSPLMGALMLVLMEDGRSITLLEVLLTGFFTAKVAYKFLARCPRWTASPPTASTSDPCAGFSFPRSGPSALVDVAGPRPRAGPHPTATCLARRSKVGTFDRVRQALRWATPFLVMFGRPLRRRPLLRCVPMDERHHLAALSLCAGRRRLAAHPSIKAITCVSAQAWASSQRRAGRRRR